MYVDAGDAFLKSFSDEYETSDDLRTSANIFEGYIEFNGSVIPFDYGNDEREYKIVRNSCGIFNITPNRKFRVSGPGAASFLDRMLTRPASAVRSGKALYAVVCGDDGFVRDDLIAYKFADDDFVVMPALDDGSRLFEALERSGVADVRIVDRSRDMAGFAVQGPASAAIMHAAGCAGVADLAPFAFARFVLAGHSVLIGRIGFTGGLGYECWFEPAHAEALLRHVVDAGERIGVPVHGYGLSVVETCRIEAGMIVPGRDFSTPLTPRPGLERRPDELGLGWLVKHDGRDFPGREALLKARETGPRHALRGARIEGRVRPANGAPLFARIDGEKVRVGCLTSSAWSCGLGCIVALASVDGEHRDAIEAWCETEAGDRLVTLVNGPLINPSARNQVPAPLAL